MSQETLKRIKSLITKAKELEMIIDYEEHIKQGGKVDE
jgi:hypothetical protein